MKPTVIEDQIFEFETSGGNESSVLIAAESSWRGMADELQELHYLKGAQFINQLKLIIYHGEFSQVEGETDIYSAISEQSDDFDNLINAARKAVEHGYRVYILAILAPFQQKGWFPAEKPMVHIRNLRQKRQSLP